MNANKPFNLHYDIADYCTTTIKKFFGALLDLLAEGADFEFTIYNTDYSVIFEIDCESEDDVKLVRNAWNELN